MRRALVPPLDVAVRVLSALSEMARDPAPPSVPGLAVALQLLHGDLEQIRREYPSVFSHGVSITRKLGFSNIIMPGERLARLQPRGAWTGPVCV